MEKDKNPQLLHFKLSFPGSQNSFLESGFKQSLSHVGPGSMAGAAVLATRSSGEHAWSLPRPPGHPCRSLPQSRPWADFPEMRAAPTLRPARPMQLPEHSCTFYSLPLCSLCGLFLRVLPPLPAEPHVALEAHQRPGPCRPVRARKAGLPGMDACRREEERPVGPITALRGGGGTLTDSHACPGPQRPAEPGSRGLPGRAGVPGWVRTFLLSASRPRVPRLRGGRCSCVTREAPGTSLVRGCSAGAPCLPASGGTPATVRRVSCHVGRVHAS